MGRLHSSLVRVFQTVIAFEGFGVEPFFGDGFNRRAEEFMKEFLFLTLVR
jgi:hypothetical protein